MNKLNTKIFLILLAVLLLLPSQKTALSWGTSISQQDFTSGINQGLTTGMPLGFDKILSDLGVNKSELRYSVQSMNVTRQKKMPPSVSVTFSPANPAPGEKVSAVATPLYFLNDVKNIYFTWFLKSADCEEANENGNTQGDYESKCDLNHDNEVDIEDYKIKAARIIASSNFEWDADGAYKTHSDSDGYTAHPGGDDQQDKNDYCFIHDVESGDEYQIGCAHLFPDAPGHETGDGSFGAAEERFWRTDPNSADTAGTGNGDEANIAGLGINTFSWNYEEGDEVGVVVEGVSIEPTQKTDSSYRIMWAATNNLCGSKIAVDIGDYPRTTQSTVSTTLDDPIAGQTTTVTESVTESIDTRAANISQIKIVTTQTETVTDSVTKAVISTGTVSGYPVTTYEVKDISESISVSEKVGNDTREIEDATDLNDCLEDSLIAPSEGGGAADRLDVSLSYFPENPLNDPVEGSINGDMLTIHSALTNAKDPKFTHYSWQVYQADEVNPDSWGDPVLKSNLPDSSQSDGLNLSTFKFRLNLAHPQKYLKVKLNVKESISGGTERKGYADVVIPIQSSSEKIKAYSANVSDNLNLSLGSDERCTNESEMNICPVAKNEIIGVKFPGSGFSDYAWAIDGAPFTYNNASGEGNTAFFPVNKNNGEKITISLSAANLKTGEKINLSKLFEVAEPKITIVSADEKTCGAVVLGNYIDVDGKAWPDYSDTNFWAISGKQIKLKAETSGFKAASDQLTWYVDSSPIISSDESLGIGLSTDGILSLPSKPIGESYAVSASALYSPSNSAKKALNQYWNLGYGQFYEKPVSDNINIEMKEETTTAAQATNKKIIAALYTSLPAYLAFLLRIVLTAFIIIVGSSWLMSFFPNLRNE